MIHRHRKFPAFYEEFMAIDENHHGIIMRTYEDHEPYIKKEWTFESKEQSEQLWQVRVKLSKVLNQREKYTQSEFHLREVIADIEHKVELFTIDLNEYELYHEALKNYVKPLRYLHRHKVLPVLSEKLNRYQLSSEEKNTYEEDSQVRRSTGDKINFVLLFFLTAFLVFLVGYFRTGRVWAGIVSIISLAIFLWIAYQSYLAPKK